MNSTKLVNIIIRGNFHVIGGRGAWHNIIFYFRNVVIFVKNFKTVHAFCSSVRPSVRRRAITLLSFVIHRQKVYYTLCSPPEYWSLLRRNGVRWWLWTWWRVIAKVSIRVRVCAYVYTVIWHLNFSMEKIRLYLAVQNMNRYERTDEQ